jgi:hypothetical protein
MEDFDTLIWKQPRRYSMNWYDRLEAPTTSANGTFETWQPPTMSVSAAGKSAMRLG